MFNLDVQKGMIAAHLGIYPKYEKSPNDGYTVDSLPLSTDNFVLGFNGDNHGPITEFQKKPNRSSIMEIYLDEDDMPTLAVGDVPIIACSIGSAKYIRLPPRSQIQFGDIAGTFANYHGGGSFTLLVSGKRGNSLIEVSDTKGNVNIDTEFRVKEYAPTEDDDYVSAGLQIDENGVLGFDKVKNTLEDVTDFLLMPVNSRHIQALKTKITAVNPRHINVLETKHNMKADIRSIQPYAYNESKGQTQLQKTSDGIDAVLRIYQEKYSDIYPHIHKAITTVFSDLNSVGTRFSADDLARKVISEQQFINDPFKGIEHIKELLPTDTHYRDLMIDIVADLIWAKQFEYIKALRKIELNETLSKITIK